MHFKDGLYKVVRKNFALVVPPVNSPKLIPQDASCKVLPLCSTADPFFLCCSVKCAFGPDLYRRQCLHHLKTANFPSVVAVLVVESESPGGTQVQCFCFSPLSLASPRDLLPFCLAARLGWDDL